MGSDPTPVPFKTLQTKAGDLGSDPNIPIRAGVCTEATREECTPNDFFIENLDDSTELYPLATNVEVVMITYRGVIDAPLSQNTISFAEFVTLITNEDAHWDSLPYTLTLNTDGEVEKIEEVYVP